MGDTNGQVDGNPDANTGPTWTETTILMANCLTNCDGVGVFKLRTVELGPRAKDASMTCRRSDRVLAVIAQLLIIQSWNLFPASNALSPIEMYSYVFVTGYHQSGTSLTEQLLSSQKWAVGIDVPSGIPKLSGCHNKNCKTP